MPVWETQAIAFGLALALSVHGYWRIQAGRRRTAQASQHP